MLSRPRTDPRCETPRPMAPGDTAPPYPAPSSTRGRSRSAMPSVAVIGGGICGLARIFRVAHADPRLCALALEARDGWTRWARDMGTRRLLGDEGLVSAGPSALAHQAPAMAAAGAPWQPVAAADIPARVPAAAADHPWG